VPSRASNLIRRRWLMMTISRKDKRFRKTKSRS
jgi:hypothetical protein